MSEPPYRMEVWFGRVRVEHRHRMDADGWLRHDSRRLEYDGDGLLYHVSEWEETGIAMKWI